MKSFKKILAVLCSATLIVSSSVTAFASEPEPDPVAPTTGTAGAGNVLSYNFDTVVVPTTIKLTFNPQGLTIAKRAGETAVTDQIVSLNYGIASKASQDKKVIVKFAANTALSGESSDVEFVDDAAKITAQANAEDTTGAPTGSHRIYLTVTPATATPTYYKDAQTAAGEAFAVTGERGHKEDNITAARLSDVVMTASETDGAAQAFAEAASEPNNSAYAILGYKLGKATYAAKEDLSFETEAADVAEKMEMTALGGITGFTFGGSMNTNTDWTKANLSAIAITPIYELEDAGDEEAIANTASAITLTEAADLAEPARPLTAEEIAAAAAEAAAQEAAAAAAAAAADAAAGFKTTHSAVLALDVDNLDGTEVEDIEAAITAFNALTDAAKEILAAENTPITAETLGALKTAAEAAAEANATPVELEGVYDTAASPKVYSITLAANVSDVSKITNIKVNGNDLTSGISTNASGSKLKLVKDDVKTANGDQAAWDATTSLVFTFTIDGTNYICTIVK